MRNHAFISRDSKVTSQGPCDTGSRHDVCPQPLHPNRHDRSMRSRRTQANTECIEITANMSSIARRACYKCGNVGHYAEVCTSSERLCYNCKQPGHESNQCTLPRTTESKSKCQTMLERGGNTDEIAAKQCYHCQGLGHVQADCPTLRISGAQGGRCYSCGQVGHLARSCPTPGQNAAPPAPRGRGGFRGGYYGVQNNRAASCFKCGGPNHYARDCQAQAIKCYACGKLVRISCSIRHFPGLT